MPAPAYAAAAPGTTQREVDAVQRRLQALRASAFHGTPAHRAASGRLRRHAAALLARDPGGEHAAGLGGALALLDLHAGCGARVRNAG